jgi:hypothetical protein
MLCLFSSTLKPIHMKNLKTTMITALLVLAMVSGAMAQEKWEFAIIRYTAIQKDYSISYSDESGLKSQNGKATTAAYYDLSHLVRYLNELSSQGWEVYSTGNNETAGEIIYHLRKKKN